MIHWMRSATFNVVDLCTYLRESGAPLRVMYEIGSAAGESAETFARYFETVHCVDPWPKPEATDDVETSFDERAQAAGNIIKHRGLSLYVAPTVADCSLDFVYLDGDHTYKAVMDDIRAWGPKLCAGAFIGGHDHNLSDVARAVTNSFTVAPVLFDDYSWCVRRV